VAVLFFRQAQEGDTPVKRLIGQAQAGDATARSQLAAALRPRLASMARHYARCCREDYDDLLGEAWFAVFDALEITNLGIGDPHQFLLKRARWRMLDYIKWARRRRCDDLDPASAPVQTAADVAPGVMGKTLLDQISEGLSSTQQAVLDGLLQGETWREVAGSLGCSSANVAYHVRQIRQHAERLVGSQPS